MNFNDMQKTVLVLGVMFFVVSFVLPPYEAESVRNITHFLGYSFITDPPDPPDHRGGVYWTVRIALKRLLLQWAVIVVGTAGVVLYLRNSRGNTRKRE